MSQVTPPKLIGKMAFSRDDHLNQRFPKFDRTSGELEFDAP